MGILLTIFQKLIRFWPEKMEDMERMERTELFVILIEMNKFLIHLIVDLTLVKVTVSC